MQKCVKLRIRKKNKILDTGGKKPLKYLSEA